MYWLLALVFAAAYGLFLRWRYSTFKIAPSKNTELSVEPGAMKIDPELRRRFSRFAAQNTLVALLLVIAFFWLTQTLGLR